MKRKPQILVLCDYYRPGWRGGGPIKSIHNLVSSLSSEYDFKIITRNHDFGYQMPYQKVEYDCWTTYDGQSVMYCAPDYWAPIRLWQTLRTEEYDLLYLNSFFSLLYSILPIVLHGAHLISSIPIVLAPKGELSAGALAIKPWRKLLYNFIARNLQLYSTVVWQASEAHESQDIAQTASRLLGIESTPTIIAKDLASLSPGRYQQKDIPKEQGSLRIVHLSRISKMKNLHWALQLLHRVHGSIVFDIYGPIEDPQYWEACKAIIRTIPPNVRVNYKGEVIPNLVSSVLANYDLMLSPTLGENFGHVILESMLSGCPVLISDRTPWRGLKDYMAGIDLPLDVPTSFVEAIEQFVSMSVTDHHVWSCHAREYAESFIARDSQASIEEHRRLFTSAIFATHTS